MAAMIAFCGIDCANCDAYQASQRNDPTEMERVAKFREEFNSSTITVADVTCDGCTNPQGRLGGHPAVCEIRACGIEHQVANCAHCAGYDGCERLAGFFGYAPNCKTTLDEIRRSLPRPHFLP